MIERVASHQPIIEAGNMSTIALGRLERVDLRTVWQSEPQGFTPWLAQPENLNLLGDAINLDLELEAQEKDVGPFRADILCKDTSDGTWVLIENQLECTDHLHLGQLMTYAAGLEAVTIVWIAERFKEEHRAALDWLNACTVERFTFFGLEVELWRIGNSPIAPKFNVVCKPNDWSKSVAEGRTSIEKGELTDAKRLQLEFWTAFRKYVEETGSPIKPTKPHPQHWMTLSLGRSGFYMHAIASLWDSVGETFGAHELRAEVVLDTDKAKQHFLMLEQMKGAIEQEVTEPLTWHNPTGKRSCRIYVRQPADIEDRQKWPSYHEWLLKKLEALRAAFGPRIKQLPSASEIASDGNGHQ